jgi:predicted RNase H-like nuclease
MAPDDAVLGVDGCPGGWIGALLTGSDVEWLLLPDAAAVLAAPAAVVGIDIPIGLPAAGPRACDVAARARLGPRRNSVFPAPVRAVLGAGTYDEACRRSRAVSGRALSKQTWHITERIADLDAALLPHHHARVVEVHPELVFARLGGVLPAKREPLGRELRVKALLDWLPAGWPEPPRPARPDDALDALACAWTARRWLAGAAEVLGGEPDERGVPMRIVR